MLFYNFCALGIPICSTVPLNRQRKPNTHRPNHARAGLSYFYLPLAYPISAVWLFQNLTVGGRRAQKVHRPSSPSSDKQYKAKEQAVLRKIQLAFGDEKRDHFQHSTAKGKDRRKGGNIYVGDSPLFFLKSERENQNQK